ncbi:MAG: hypothetical protein AAF611_09610 [Bacteroidota bacterium]
MIETTVSLTVNKEDIDVIKEVIIQHQIQAPVVIVEYEFNYHIYFTDQYEYWELESNISRKFEGFKFSEDLSNGKEEIKLQLHRYQCPLSTDGWGRPIEDPINQTKYLIKKEKESIIKFNPKIEALFEDEQYFYHVNIVPGINKETNEEGFLVIDEFNNIHNNDSKQQKTFLKNELFKNPVEAFSRALSSINQIAEIDFEEYKKMKKRKKRKKSN